MWTCKGMQFNIDLYLSGSIFMCHGQCVSTSTVSYMYMYIRAVIDTARIGESARNPFRLSIS